MQKKSDLEIDQTVVLRIFSYWTMSNSPNKNRFIVFHGTVL